MSRSRPEANYRNLLRFYRFALPQWKWLVLFLVATMAHQTLKVGSLILLKPTFDAMAHKAEIAREAPTEQQAEAAAQAAAASLPPGLDKGGGILYRLPPIAALMRWLGGNLARTALLIVAFLAPMLLLAGFTTIYAQRRVVWVLLADVRMRVFRQLSELSLGYFSRQRTGDIVSRLTNDLASTHSALKLLFGRVVEEPLQIALALFIAFDTSWQLSLVALVAFPFLALATGRYGRKIRRYGARALIRLADVTDTITQVLSGMRVVKSFNMEEAENQNFRRINRRFLDRALKLTRNRALAESVPEIFLYLPMAGILLVGNHLLGQGSLTAGDVVQCFAALWVARGPARRLVHVYADLQSAIPGVNRIFELVDQQPDIQDSPDAVEIPGVGEGVRFEDVWFSYDNTPVLKGIDLFVPSGKVYAIVGETGAGKSTMLDLIPRFYDVQRGAVRVDGVDVRKIARNSLMRQIAVVGQHPFLFNRSIAENIRYGNPGATDEAVVAAAKAAHIHQFIQSLPEGYDTRVGETGSRLSGGQRQCVTIARALLKNAPILILDEATSSLDAESEAEVQEALGNLMKDRTTFVIAHRLSTVRHADRIIVLRDGAIVEQGTHEELLQMHGEYARLYRLQFAGGAADLTQ